MNNNRFMSSSNAQVSQIDLGLRSYMLGVYNHMTTALALTGLMAMGLNFRETIALGHIKYYIIVK